MYLIILYYNKHTNDIYFFVRSVEDKAANLRTKAKSQNCERCFDG